MSVPAITQWGMDLPPGARERPADQIRIRELFPSPFLREFVRAYHYMEMQLGGGTLIKPVTARPELMLQCSVRRPFTVIHNQSGVRGKAPEVVIVGRQTRRNVDLLATGDPITLTVHFQPAGFYRLFHMPMPYLTDLAPDAVDVVGPKIRLVHERIAESHSFEEMVGHVEMWLQSLVAAACPFHPVQATAESLLRGRGASGSNTMAAETGLSLRQFERVFREQVGIGPKLFSRIVRFAEALQAKSEEPHRTWAEVAPGAGYFARCTSSGTATISGGSPRQRSWSPGSTADPEPGGGRLMSILY